MMRAAPNPTLEEKEQYHHYIPRFVLRAFAAQPQPSYDEPTPPVRGRRKKKRNRQRQPPGMLKIPQGRYHSVSIWSRKLLIMTGLEMIRLMKQTLPMLSKSPNLQCSSSLPATSQHDLFGKRRKRNRSRQRQPMGMLRIPKGRYHLVSIKSKKLLILTVSNMICLMKWELPMLPKSPNP